MSTIFKKECILFFHSMIGYVYLAVFSVISGYYFFTCNLLAASGNIQNYFSSVMTVMMFLIPMLTMRTLSEEKKMHTDQLLIASPVSSFSIILGKYLACVFFFCISLIPSVIHVVWLSFFTKPPLRLIACCTAGLLFTAAAFLAIGLFISSVTENQVIACVVTYGVLLLLWLIGYAGNYISIEWLKNLLNRLSLLNRCSNFTQGILSLSDLLYPASLSIFFLFLCTAVFEQRRTN